MLNWNVVVTVYEGGYNQAKRFLEQFGPVTRTDFFNLLVMRTADHQQFLEEFHSKAGRNLEDASSVARVMPVIETFTFQTPEEFDTKAQQAVCTWLPTLANKGFHLRMHRRGFKGKLSSMDEERFLDDYLLQALKTAGTPGHITFENPDVIIALETIGTRAGLSAWTRAELKRFPFLHLD
ncbi:MAG TPA: THUMP domain-containing protein [Desulfuromonadaceae bacterium]|jgi:tRNA(Ser,Leu) C12 N-acetylase TAN1